MEHNRGKLTKRYKFQGLQALFPVFANQIPEKNSFSGGLQFEVLVREGADAVGIQDLLGGFRIVDAEDDIGFILA